MLPPLCVLVAFNGERLFPQTRKKSPVISPDEQDERRDVSPEERELKAKSADAEENCRETDDVESGNANLENKVRIHKHTFPWKTWKYEREF